MFFLNKPALEFLFLILFLILNLFLVISLIFLIVEFSNFILRRVPSLPTSSRAIKFILEIIGKEKDERKTFVDLGSGMAKVLIQVKKKYPEIEVIGYESWPSQFFLAKIMLFFSGINANIFYRNLFQADLLGADIVYFYLFPNLMERLANKLKKELKEGALVISNSFPLPTWQPKEIITTNPKNPNFEKLFIYIKD